MGVYKDRKIAVKNFHELVADPSQVFCIHYSQSQTFEDDYGNISPIITCIVIKSLDEAVDKQFAIHFEADKAGIPKDQIQDSYRELELRILKSFNDFVRRNKDCLWVHWDMKNIHFGFEAIKHRYEKIFENTEDFEDIPSNKKYNLLLLLEGMYGENFVSGSDRLKAFMTANNDDVDDPKYLSTGRESSDFDEKNFKGVIDSVDCKVEFLKKAAGKLLTRKLVIPNKNSYALFLDIVTHPIFSFIGFVGSLVGLAIAIYSLF